MHLWLIGAFAVSVLGYGLDFIGTLTPYDEPAVSMSINNAGETADYTFKYIPSTTIPAGGTVTVTFPEQFDSSLGMTGNPTCTSGTCTRSGRVVTVTLTAEATLLKASSFVIKGVLNPSKSGGTGNFDLQSRKGVNILDQNKVFASVGIAPAITELTSTSVSIETGGSSKVGATTNYEFTFTIQKILPIWSWLRFTFPSDGYTLANTPACSAMTISGFALPGTLLCTSSGNQVTLTGISSEIPAKTDLGVKISATNPIKAITTSTFTIETGRNSTSTVYERKKSIPEVKITAGSLSSVNLAAVDTSIIIATSKQMLYRLKFTPTTTVPQGGSINILCNNNFYLDGYKTLYVESGLTDIAFTNQVTLAYVTSTKTLSITNFSALTATEVSLVMHLTNPSTSGTAQALIVRTLDASGNTIDEDTTKATVTISTYSAPTISTSFLNTAEASGTNIQLKFTITPQVQIPKLGYIKIKPATGFTISTLTCLMKPKNVSENAPASCTYSSTTGLITLQLFSSTATAPTGNGDFLVSVDSTISITAGVTAPSLAGDYFWDFNTYDQNSVLLESGQATVTLTANLITGAVQFVHKEENLPTLIKFTFTPDIAIPTGATPASSATTQGFIEILLDGSRYSTGLGMSLTTGSAVPCRGISGISASTSGGQISCIYTSHSTTGNVVITISQFAAISANTAVEVHLAGIVNHGNQGSTSTMTISSYSLTNRVKQYINTKTSITDPDAAAATATATSAITPALSSSVVSASATLTLTSLDTNTATTATTPFILFHINPTHDAGYCTYSSITCTNDAASVTCRCYPGADMILLEPTGDVSGAAHTFVVSGLVNPESVYSAYDTITTYVCGNGDLKKKVTITAKIPDLTTGTFTNSLAQAEKIGLNVVNNKIKVSALPQHAIPANGYFVISFPSGFSLSSSSPVPTCVADNFVALTSSGVTCTISSNQVTVGNFKEVTASSTLQVTVSGVKNPSSGSITGSFEIRTTNSANRTIDNKTDVTGITLSTAYTKGTVVINSVLTYPNNFQTEAEYRIRLSTTNGIPVGGSLTVTFPSANYGSMSSTISCRVSEAISTYKSCANSGNVVTLTMDTKLNANEIMSLSVFGVSNPDVEKASYFTAISAYDGVTLDQSPDSSSLNEQVAILTSAASTLIVNSISFYPKNEGEIATYSFSITPGKDIATDQSIIITFPQTYDKRIGDRLRCSASGITGNLSCSLTGAYELTVVGQDKFTACTSCKIVINVHGVINPTKYTSATSGNFGIGIRKSTTYSMINTAAGTVSFEAAPGVNDLLGSMVDTLYSRYENDIYLNFTTSNTIPKSSYNGAIWVTLPLEYVLDDSSISCTSSNFWAAGRPTCTQYYERMLLSGQSSDYVGNMFVKLFDVPNPLTEINAKSIIVETYDGYNYKIIDRSYPNLSPSRYSYVYPGPIIEINQGKSVTIERGTMSDLLYVSLSSPSALNLTLIPYSSGFSFDPYAIEIDIGDLKKAFRISVPVSTDVNSYIATWQVDGDLMPTYYTPILKTEFNVVANKNVTVTCDSIVTIPKGGRSLPTFVTLGAAPDVDVTVLLEVVNSISGISLSSSNLTYTPGETKKSFVVSVSNSTQYEQATLSLTLSGTNKNAYSFRSSTVGFKTQQLVLEAPTISNIYFSTLTRTTAEVYLTTGQISTVYYACALKGTPPPTFEEVMNQLPPLYNTTQTTYGVAVVGDTYLTSFVLTGLTAETDYTVYAYAVDLMDQVSRQPFYNSFKTQARYSTAFFALKFTSRYLTEVQVADTISSVSLILSLNYWRIAEKNIDNIIGGRRLQQFANTRSTLELYIFDDPATDNYKSPIGLTQDIGTQLPKLATMVEGLDTSYIVQGQLAYANDCAFEEAPEISATAARNAIAIKAQLKEDGYIYAIAVKADEDVDIATSKQIKNRLDSRNYPAVNSWSQAYGQTYANVTLANLEGETSYNVYVTCGNKYPGEPELLSDNKVVAVNWRIEAINLVKPLDLDSAYILGLCLSVVLVFA